MAIETSTSGTKTPELSSPKEGDAAAKALKTAVVTGAHDFTAGAKHLAEDVAGQTKKAAESQITLGKSKAADGLGSVADALRKTGDQMRLDDDGALPAYLDQAAQKVDAASSYLKDRSLSQLVGDVKQFARREPALFLGGALVVGLIGGRFLKSSHPESPRTSGGARESEPRKASKNVQSADGNRRDVQSRPLGDHTSQSLKNASSAAGAAPFKSENGGGNGERSKKSPGAS